MTYFLYQERERKIISTICKLADLYSNSNKKNRNGGIGERDRRRERKRERKKEREYLNLNQCILRCIGCKLLDSSVNDSSVNDKW